MPHAIPQTHPSFYPHRSWTLLWLASTQSTFLKLFRCSRFSELDSKQIQENFILSHFLSLLERANTNYIVKFNLRSGKEEAQIRISDYAHTVGVDTVEWTWQLMKMDCGYYGVIPETTIVFMLLKLMCKKIPFPRLGVWIQVWLP